MKSIFLSLFILLFSNCFAQKPCEYSTNITDSLGVYKTTKSYIVHERNFGGSSNYLFFSLIRSQETPYLSIQTIQNSNAFIKANCFDSDSKLFFQLANGKIITMQHTDDQNCGTLLRGNNEYKNSRVNAANFVFQRGSIQDLRQSPIVMLRIKYGAETVDYVFVKELQSLLTNEKYFPEDYFISYLNCVEN